MNFLAQLIRGGSRRTASRTGAYSHRSAKESVGRRVYSNSLSTSRNHDGSSRIGVGTVLVMLQETPDGPRPPPLRVVNKEGKLIPRDHFFLAVIAPDHGQALAFLDVQPAGTFVLVKLTADDLAVYIKFHAAVRSFTVIHGKDIQRAKPTDDLVEWGRAYRPLSAHMPHAEAILAQSTLMTPVHRLVLPPIEFAYLERCWLHFLPQVQAIAFELCTQPYYMDEDIEMEGWDQFILASRVPCVAFVSVDCCGFHLFNTTAIARAATATTTEITNALNAASLATATATVAVPVRVVEFDVAKCLISIVDGVFRPNAIVSPVHFGAAKYYDVALGFQAIRENFLSPERVVLKEAAAASSTNGQAGVSPWQDLHALDHAAAAAGDDAELRLMVTVRSLVAAVVPHEPLPEGLLDALSRLHALWTSAPSRSRWRTPIKIQCAAQILPFYLELLLAVAPTDPYVTQDLLKANRPDPLPHLATRLEQDVRLLARRADDASVSRLVHHVLQSLALRARVPPLLVSLVGDLCVELHHFRVLFLRNQGMSLLWTAIHTSPTLSLTADDDDDDELGLPQLFQRINPLLSELTKRRSSLFSNHRKSHEPRAGERGARKSLAFNRSIVLPVTMESTVRVFFRLNPVLVQLELAVSPRHPQEDACEPGETHSTSSSPSSTQRTMVACIVRVALLLMADPSSPTWEKDVQQLLRMDSLYELLYQGLVAGVAASADVDTALVCVASLYRLETKQRRRAGPNLGDKKYWVFYHLLRSPVRAFHEHMREKLYAMTTDTPPLSSDFIQDAGDLSGDSSSSAESARLGFAMLAHVLPRLPRQMVTEFVLVSLDDVLQATRILHAYLQQRPRGIHTYVAHVRLIIAILTIVLRGTCDLDLQLLLVRVLSRSGSTVPAMLQQFVHAARHNNEEIHALEMEVLAFAEAFVACAASLSQRERWHATRESLASLLDNRDDVEGNEQRKTMLMSTVLSPENGVADSDEILWDTLQDIVVPTSILDAISTRERLCVVEQLYSKGDDAGVPVAIVKQYLRVRARVFLSPILEMPAVATPVQLRGFLDFHWNCLCGLRGQFRDHCSVDSELEEAEALARLHLQCLMALASRREQVPALNEAFLDSRMARQLLAILQQATTNCPSKDLVSEMDAAQDQDAPALGLSLNLKRLHSHIGASASPQTTPRELVVASPALHAAALLTILACTLSDPQSLDERIVPRFFLPPETAAADSNSSLLQPDEDLLLSLQRHLILVDSPALRAALYAGLHEVEVDHQCGEPPRAHAVRTLVQLLLPDSYDAHLYACAASSQADNSDDDDELDGQTQREGALASLARTYIARGAFATVYRATPSIGHSDVAIKVCAHQRSSGERCVAAEVFSEVVVLERLRGNLAATQLLDFGNNTQSSMGFELVLEHCPASLPQWRRSLALGAVAPPFRSLLSLTLGVFLDVARAVRRIHASGVCHFDIKADNVMLRVEPHKMTAALLREHGHDDSVSVVPRLCLADFGESVVIAEPGQTFQLKRTRGTEAIKSPEMLRVTGGQGASGVGPASDVWSLGCLLFEMVTEELMFANDDWAQLYAHLVAPLASGSSSTPPVVRDDHQQKLLDVLAPSTDAEKRLASDFLQFLESLLNRDALGRPTIDQLIDRVDTQRRAVLSLPSQLEDDAFRNVAVALVQGLPTTTAPVMARPPPPPLVHLRRPPVSLQGPLAGRLFSNLFLARDLRALRHAAARFGPPLRRPQTANSASTCTADALLQHELSTLQLAIEPRFAHVIYFCYDNVMRQSAMTDADTIPTHDASSSAWSSSSSGGAFLEIVEGVGRTIFYFSRAQVVACLRPEDDSTDQSSATTSVTSARRPDAEAAGAGRAPLVQLLLQHARGILATLQRHLRHQSGRVLLVPADHGAFDNGKHATDSPLQELTAAAVLFFLTTSLALAPLEAIALFSRECHALVALPSARVLQDLLLLHEELHAASLTVVSTERSLYGRACVRCRCGDKVLACKITHSGPQYVPPPVSADVDAEIVWARHETGSASASEPWVVVDTLEVERLDSLLRTVLRRQLGIVPVTRGRRRSQEVLGPRHAPTGDAASALREHVPFLLHGLAQVPTEHAAAWTLYECGQCGTRVCAVHATADRLALPFRVHSTTK